jgi:translation initiation factor IF-3
MPKLHNARIFVWRVKARVKHRSEYRMGEGREIEACSEEGDSVWRDIRFSGRKNAETNQKMKIVTKIPQVTL